MQQVNRVLEEVLTTERAYVADLEILAGVFLVQLQAQLASVGVELTAQVDSLLRVHR